MPGLNNRVIKKLVLAFEGHKRASNVTASSMPESSLTAAATTTVRPVAVIDIGTTAIRMAIAEIDSAGNIRTLETVTQGVDLGKDTFTRGIIRRSTIEDCVKVLKSYRQLLREFQIVNHDQIRIVATSAVREATNRLAFLDRIYIATGLTVEPLEEAEVNRITFLGIKPFLHSEPSLATSKTLVHLSAGFIAAARNVGRASAAETQSAFDHAESDREDSRRDCHARAARGHD